MSQKILVPICVGFVVVASCVASAFFLAKSPKSQGPLRAVAPASTAVTGVVSTPIDTPQAVSANASPDRAAKTSATTATATVPQPQAGGPSYYSVQDQTSVTSVTQTQPNAQAVPGPSVITQTVAGVVAQAPRRGKVGAPPMPQTQQPTLQATIPSAMVPNPIPVQAPNSAAKTPQSVEAVVVTGQRPQQIPRTDIDAIGRGNSLTIQLPKRPK